MIKETMEAANLLAEDGIQCEVIDVATLNPLDRETILASVGKTGRCVIIHEAPLNCSVGSEIASILASEALFDLRAPVARVGGYDTVMPYFRLEDQYMPDTKQIVEAVKRTLEYS